MLRIIGDVHCKIPKYLELIKNVEFSVQVGDIGYGKCLENIEKQADPAFHKVCLGNHDNYDNIIPHSLGDFGIITLGGVTFGYIRGEHSVDKQWRTAGLDWWPQEEMDMERMNECVSFFEGKALDLMISHGCPDFVIDSVSSYAGRFRPSMTSMMLSEVSRVCSIQTHCFGHHHNHYDNYHNGTRYICLPELAYIDVEDERNV